LQSEIYQSAFSWCWKEYNCFRLSGCGTNPMNLWLLRKLVMERRADYWHDEYSVRFRWLAGFTKLCSSNFRPHPGILVI
jgi:hypothetical protein